MGRQRHPDTILYETTKKKVHETLAEIDGLLSEFGLRRIQMINDDEGLVSAVYFSLAREGGEGPYFLEVNPEALLEMAAAGKTRHLKAGDREQDLRIVWRQIKKWMELQVEVARQGILDAEQLFLGLLQVRPDVSLYDHYKEEWRDLLIDYDYKALQRRLPAHEDEVS